MDEGKIIEFRKEIVGIEEVPEDWRNKVIEDCENMSLQIEKAWVCGIREGEKWLPGQGKALNDNKLMMLEIFFDYLFGTFLAVATHYGSTSEEFEEYVAHKLSEKFERLRGKQK
jgi:hypothetical protein